MEKVWYTVILGTNPANEYHIGDFNYALFTVTDKDYQVAQ